MIPLRGLFPEAAKTNLPPPRSRCIRHLVANRENISVRGPAQAGRSGMKVRVVCYEGYCAGETPRSFIMGERPLEVTSVLDRWRGEDHEYVKLSASDGNRYVLRYDRNADEWEIVLMQAPGRPPTRKDARKGS
jgi:hypothetical protein